jgi:hypothetical protein
VRIGLSSLVLPAAIALGACRGQARDQLLAVVQHGKYGYIDQTGRVIIQPQFIWADDFLDGAGSVYVCGHKVSRWSGR